MKDKQPPILTALAVVRRAVGEVAEDRCWSLTDAEVESALSGVVAARAQLDELGLRLLSTAGQRGLGGAAGSASLASWWGARSGRTRGAAGADVRLADALDRSLALTRAAMAAGVLSVEQASVIDRSMQALPEDVPADGQSDAEAFLVEQAAGREGTDRLTAAAGTDPPTSAVIPGGPLGLGPKELTRLGRRLFEVIDPERADEHEGRLLDAEEAQAHRLTWLRMRPVGDGTTRGSFRLPDAQADMLRTVLEGYASPRRQRPAAADAASDAGRDGDAGAGSGTRRRAGDKGHPQHTGLLTEAWTDTVGQVTDLTDRPETTPLTLGHDQRLGLALCELLEHVPLDKLPQAGGVAATIGVTLQLQHLLSGLGAATLSTGTRISAGQARRLACGAGLLPIVFDGPSLVLDAGRDKRLYDRGDRVVMGTRDGGCVFPGCDRPPAWCEAHHLTSWAKAGGRTDVADGCLLCPFHHRLIHQGQWSAHMSADGVPEIVPPARIDPAQRPRRHERFQRRAPARRRE